MSRASRTVLAIFAVYWLLAVVAPALLLRPGALVLEQAGRAVTIIVWALMSYRAVAAGLGMVGLLAAAGWILRFRPGGKRPGFPFLQAGWAVYLILYLYFYCYAAIVILYVPYMDPWFPAAAGVVMAVAFYMEMRLKNMRAMRPAGVSAVAGSCIAVCAAGFSLAVVSNRAGVLMFAVFLAALQVFDFLAAARLVRWLHLPENAFQHPMRRSLVILAAMCAVGMHTFLTTAPYFCKTARAGKNTIPVLRHADAFDVVSANGYLFATFKDGALARIEKDNYAAVRTVRPTNAPLQRLAYDPGRNRVYVSVYKSDTPVLAVDAQTLHTWPLAVQSDCAATDVAFSKSSGAVYFPCEPQFRVYAVDAATGRQIAKKQLPRTSNIYSLALDDEHGLLYGMPATLSPYLYAMDARTLDVKRRVRVGIVNQGIALHPERHVLYITRFMGARVMALDTRGYQSRASIPAGHIVRDIQAAGECRLLAGDYAQATARLIDVCARRTLRVWRVCPRVRGVYFDNSTGRAYAATGCGVFELKMP